MGKDEIYLQQQAELITRMERLINIAEAGKKATLRREWIIGNAGETKNLPNIDAKTLYVDNTNNANVISVNLDGGLGIWQVPANGTKYIPCEGARSIAFAGIGQCRVMCVNRDLDLATINAVQNVNASIVGSLPNDGLTPMSTDVARFSELYNELTWDRRRGNTQGTLLASAARTASLATPIITNFNSRGVQVLLNVTAASGTGGLKVSIIGRSIGGNYYQISATPAAIVTTGKFAYEVYPGAATNAGDIVSKTSSALPRMFYCYITAGDSTSYTYSLEYNLIN